jgi:uncharacterized membrane protein YccC
VTEEQRGQGPAITQPEGLQIFNATAALLVGRRSMRIFSLLAPCRSLKSLATHLFLFMRWVLKTPPCAILPKGMRQEDHARMKFWNWQKENLPSIGHSVRTALAATASVIVARSVQMPEAYWAAIATLVVMQSSLGATLTLSIERVVATALGASVGAVEANYFGANLAAFMLAIFFIGLLSYGFRLEKTAYRYASVTLTIIVLIPRTNPAWIVALHRFIEVSVGIIVALAVVAFWPERSAIAEKNAAA